MKSSSYAGLAMVFGTLPDIAAFKRFRVPNSHNLLYLQAEITHTWMLLAAATETNDAVRSGSQVSLERSVEELIQSSNGVDGPWDLAMKLRALLKEYSMLSAIWTGFNFLSFPAHRRLLDRAILSYREICRLPSVNPHDLAQFRGWYRKSTGGNSFLTGAECLMWENESDLLSLTRDHGAISGTLLKIQTAIITWIHGLFDNKEQEKPHLFSEPALPFGSFATPITAFSDAKVSSITTVITTALASIIPTLSIFVLYFVQSQVTRLGIIMILTTAFSVALALSGRVRSSEAFACSAAFAAVLVVFVGGPDVHSSRSSHD